MSTASASRSRARRVREQRVVERRESPTRPSWRRFRSGSRPKSEFRAAGRNHSPRGGFKAASAPRLCRVSTCKSSNSASSISNLRVSQASPALLAGHLFVQGRPAPRNCAADPRTRLLSLRCVDTTFDKGSANGSLDRQQGEPCTCCRCVRAVLSSRVLLRQRSETNSEYREANVNVDRSSSRRPGSNS